MLTAQGGPPSGPIFLLKASFDYRDSEPVTVVSAAPAPSGPAPGSPEYEAALIAALAARPDLLEKAIEAAKAR